LCDFFFSSRRRHTRSKRDWSSDVCSSDLAKEWAVCRGDSVGYLHVYELDISGLKILDFDNEDILSWIAELMKHRDADKSQNYKEIGRASCREREEKCELSRA